MVSNVKFSLLRSNPGQFWKIAGWLVPTAALGLIWVATRIWGVLPKILGDELIYSTNARWLPIADSSVPNYLFNMVFGMTNSCGYGFYTCGKAVNLLFLVGFAVFVYLAARLLVEPPLALMVGFLALVGPVSTYASYFTPDMMFYFGASIIIYFTLRQDKGDTLVSWLLIGTGLGVVTLIKPHALFLIPPIVIFIIFLGAKAGKSAVLKSALSAVLFVVMAFATKFAFGFAVAGEKGLAIFGGSYDSSANNALSGINTSLEPGMEQENISAVVAGGVLGTVGWQVAFHLAVWLIFAGLPLLLMLKTSVSSLKVGSGLTTQSKINFFLLIALVALIGVSAVFVALSNSFGEALQNRVMTRYYDYLTPFLPLAVLTALSTEDQAKKSKLVYAAIAIVILGVALPNLTAVVPALFTDSALVASAIQSGVSFWVLAIVSVAVLIFWVKDSVKATRFWLYGLTPALLLLFSISTYMNMTVPSSFVGPYTTGARYAHDNLSQEDRKHLIVIGNTPQNSKAAALWIDEPKAQWLYMPAGSLVDLNSYPEDMKYFLIVGDFSINGEGLLVHKEESWVLIQNSTAEEIKKLQAQQSE